ncbi:MAG TPA: pyrrolo-quinoline quinone [Verrucomicrobiae bacterium]|nr:pyrrolo-quinoline quinone [Verrucomicrobiae bacterium]
MKRIAHVVLLAFLASGLPQFCQGQVSVLTYHNDNARTGANTNETILTPALVRSNVFKRAFTCAVDGYVYAQPLVAAGVNVPKAGTRNVVYIATEHDSVYAFDADTGRRYWHAKLLPPHGRTVSSIKDVGCDDLIPEIGVTSTPVIDATTDTLYVLEKGKTNTVFFQRLHALDLATGAEKFGGPVTLSASVEGTGDGSANGEVPYDSLRQHQRSALLFANGVVYIASAAHCDIGPYHGWILGYGATNLQQVAVFNSTPNGGLGGVWMAGGGPAADGQGNIFCSTGNGTFDANTNGDDYGDSVLMLDASNGLAVEDYFTPFNQSDLDANDTDLGSGGVLLLPDQPGAHPHEAIMAGKEGKLYLLDRDDLGEFQNGSDSQIVQSLPNATGHAFYTPAYFNGFIYCQGEADVLKCFSITNGLLSTNPVSQSATAFDFPGAQASVSANGTNNAIVWTIEADAYTNNGVAVLHAYDATDLTQELFNSTTRRQPPGKAVKFAMPTIANGHVYVGAVRRVVVYGVR